MPWCTLLLLLLNTRRSDIQIIAIANNAAVAVTVVVVDDDVSVVDVVVSRGSAAHWRVSVADRVVALAFLAPGSPHEDRTQALDPRREDQGDDERRRVERDPRDCGHGNGEAERGGGDDCDEDVDDGRAEGCVCTQCACVYTVCACVYTVCACVSKKRSKSTSMSYFSQLTRPHIHQERS